MTFQQQLILRIKKKLFIYLTVLVLSCSMQDLRYVMQVSMTKI